MRVARAVRLAGSEPGVFVRRARAEAASETARLVRRARRRTGAAVRAVAVRSGLPRVGTRAARVSAAETSYFAVLDGHTLNLRARVPDRPGETPPGRAEVVFARRGEEVRAPAEAAAGEVTATVLLGAALGGVPIGDGTWRVELAVPIGGGERRLGLRGAPGSGEPAAARAAGRGGSGRPPAPGGAGAGGPTAVRPPCPRTGVRYTPRPSSAGMYLLRVTPPAPSAEVTRVRVALDRVEIGGRLVGLPPGAVELRFIARAGDREHRVAAVTDGPCFRATVPLESLVEETADSGDAGGSPAAGAAGAERVWDVFAEVDGHERLRVGRRLHDIRDPRRALRLPQRAVAPRPGVLARVRPYYTGTGDLVLACAPIGVSV